jgi:signal transduction histidine kinase
MAPMLTLTLSRALGASPDRVRVWMSEVETGRRALSVKITRDTAASRERPSLVPAVKSEQRIENRIVVVSQFRSDDSPRDINLEMIGENVVFPGLSAAWERPDGRWAVLEPQHPLLSPWQLRTLVALGLGALVLAPAAWFTARRLARPIHAFASAAERLGRDPRAPPLPAAGPAEVRTAVAAFNDMQEKLRRYVDERTAMVAAIAHDLRTPLMRLRFLIESAPEDIRARTIADIEQMDSMISAALAYARGEAEGTAHEPLDLGALVSAVVDDMAETGRDVTFQGLGPLRIAGDALGLKRLAANLVDNAVKFGGRARVGLSSADGFAILTVDDDGPGLPPEELERVFEPFHRADASRSSAVGGFGLGLSAARTIARAHGGEVTLANRVEGGLRATVRLPAGEASS